MRFLDRCRFAFGLRVTRPIDEQNIVASACHHERGIRSAGSSRRIQLKAPQMQSAQNATWLALADYSPEARFEFVERQVAAERAKAARSKA